jgi:hypothetical protein
MLRQEAGSASGLVVSVVASALALAAALPAAAQVPTGAEFQVNTYTSSYQGDSSVAMDPDGEFLVVWKSYGSSETDTDGFSIQGQRYSSDGSALGTEFQVNTYTTGSQEWGSVAVDPDGDLVVVWRGPEIHGQRYASDGSPQGGQFQVNTYTTSNQHRPAVAAAPDGGFVVVWQSQGSSGTDTSQYSTQGRRYASDGSAQGGQFQVNTYTTGSQATPSVTVTAAGDFVVAWHSLGSSGGDNSFNSIQGQRYASDGSAQGGEFQINSYTTGYQVFPSISSDADGDFVVVWHSAGSSGTDTSGNSIQAQRYASDGSALGTQFQVNTYTTNDQIDVSVAMEPDGVFAVVWESIGSSGTDTDQRSIQGKRYASDGSVLKGGEFQVNTATAYGQENPSLAASASGFVVTWVTENSVPEAEVWGQLYSPAIVPSLSPGSAAAAALLMLASVAIAFRRRA